MKIIREILILTLAGLFLCGCSEIDKSKSQETAKGESKNKNMVKLEMDREELIRLRNEHHIHIEAMREIYTQ